MHPAPSPSAIPGSFVSEPIQPEAGTFDTEAMARAEPGVPRAFVWRGERYAVAAVLAKWKTHGEDRGDTYVRRHWFDVVTESGHRMRLYFDRNPTNRGRAKGRWWLYTVEQPPEG